MVSWRATAAREAGSFRTARKLVLTDHALTEDGQLRVQPTVEVVELIPGRETVDVAPFIVVDVGVALEMVVARIVRSVDGNMGMGWLPGPEAPFPRILCPVVEGSVR
jgi:hypothetical protein